MPVDTKTERIVRCECGDESHWLRWVEEDVQKDADALPDGAYRILTLVFPDSSRRAFLSKECLLKWLAGHAPEPVKCGCGQERHDIKWHAAIVLFDNRAFSFFARKCFLNWMAGFAYPRSPRELAAETAAGKNLAPQEATEVDK